MAYLRHRVSKTWDFLRLPHSHPHAPTPFTAPRWRLQFLSPSPVAPMRARL